MKVNIKGVGWSFVERLSCIWEVGTVQLVLCLEVVLYSYRGSTIRGSIDSCDSCPMSCISRSLRY